MGVARAADPGVEWLLGAADPAVRLLARRDLLGEPGGGAAEMLTLNALRVLKSA